MINKEKKLIDLNLQNLKKYNPLNKNSVKKKGTYYILKGQ